MYFKQNTVYLLNIHYDNMAQDSICRPILLGDIAFSIFFNWHNLKKNYSIDFHGRGPYYFKFMQLWQEELEK